MREGEIIAFLVTFVGLVGAIVTPMLKLNSTINRLIANFDNLNKHNQYTDKTIIEHEARLDAHDIKLAEHDTKLNDLIHDHRRIHDKKG